MKILLAVDGSESSLAAVEETARNCWPQGSVVKIVSVAEVPVPPAMWAMPMPGSSYEQLEKIIEERCSASIAQAIARFTEIAGANTELTSKMLTGDPKSALLDEAERWQPDLIVVGTHGYNAFERFWLGSVSRAVLAHSHSSVQIVRKPKESNQVSAAMRVLLAVDGSECSNAAVEEIASRPWPRGTEVQALSVIHLPFTPTPEVWMLSTSDYARMEQRGREQAEVVVNTASLRLRESNAEREIPLTLTGNAIVGHAEETILETAKAWNADLIVLGSHGYGGFKRFLLGSVSQAVASHAPCSVEVVRQAACQEA
ncbi:MAG: universal stress protein [Blastocatellia bacterium]